MAAIERIRQDKLDSRIMKSTLLANPKPISQFQALYFQPAAEAAVIRLAEAAASSVAGKGLCLAEKASRIQRHLHDFSN